MKSRCSRPNHPQWKDYGGRGIVVCERWEKFENFLADIGPKPSKAHTLDRIDNDRGYEPGNCRWATRTMQSRNSRSARLSEKRATEVRQRMTTGERQIDVARSLGVSRGTIRRVMRGQTWATEAA